MKKVRHAALVCVAVALCWPARLSAVDDPQPQGSIQDSVTEDEVALDRTPPEGEAPARPVWDPTHPWPAETAPLKRLLPPREQKRTPPQFAADLSEVARAMSEVLGQPPPTPDEAGPQAPFNFPEAMGRTPAAPFTPVPGGTAVARSEEAGKAQKPAVAAEETPQTAAPDPRPDIARHAAVKPPHHVGPAVARQEEPTADPRFPTSPVIEQQKRFWIEIFTHYDSHAGVLHDERVNMTILESLDLRGMSYRAQLRHVRARKRALARDLLELADAMEAGAPLSAAQQALRERLPQDASPDDVRLTRRYLRFQRGLADRFKEGIERSEALLELARERMRRHNVPEDLAFLPHVESSFNNDTLSRVGAAGIWQFMRSTGRHYMEVTYELDERLDPVIAADAAARFLRSNYEMLGTWPLAITAYNHGPGGLAGIARRMGTKDLGTLIREYHGGVFRFASKNFYAEFLAAREVALHPERYFDDLEPHEPLRFNTVKLPYYVSMETMLDVLGTDEGTMRRLNPALRYPVWTGSKHIPKGYELRYPADAMNAEALLAAIPAEQRADRQQRTWVVQVRRGDTLYDIGRRNGVSWRVIAEANNISAYHRLMPGQKLVIPRQDGSPPPEVAQLQQERERQRVESARRAVPVEAAAQEPDAPQALPAGALEGDIAARFQVLKLIDRDENDEYGEIIAAYGETVGHYAEWADVEASQIRRANQLGYGQTLRPGTRLIVPLRNVSAERFNHHRLAFHYAREQEFFSEYNITEIREVQVRPGQSAWNLAQDNNVPMWLFYRENPELLTDPMKPGMRVSLPVVQQMVAINEPQQNEGTEVR